MANHHKPASYALLQTIPGVGKILALVMLYEIENIHTYFKTESESLSTVRWFVMSKNGRKEPPFFVNGYFFS